MNLSSKTEGNKMNTVKAWIEHVTIPTYEIGTPEKYPVFLEKRVYQGSSGAVYPFPVIEKISDEKIDKEWEVIYLENDFIKIMVIPSLGGRVQMAYDKINQRHFVYYNHVIKPALVGLTGPWISGGIEFNWPQHHRPSTYDPLEYFIEDNLDGSKTVWVNEVERMSRTKGMAGFTLYTDKAYLEVKGRIFNRTPHPQTFLWWANPAVAVTEDYQSVFPPDVNAVFDHGKRDVSEFPIARGEYYKVNYAPGTDISWYKNIPVPTSYMAITSRYNFVGGYDHKANCGLLHVANHHISPGKKQWTWGNGDFGKAWENNLTDDDGPYIELMCGVYTDNQPDFSWLHPYEEKSFKQYFMPYHSIGDVKIATKDVLLNLDIENENFVLKIHVTSGFPNCHVMVSGKDGLLIDQRASLSPAKGFYREFPKSNTRYSDLTATLQDENQNILLTWKPESPSEHLIPEPARAALQPSEIENNEDLYLTGLHLEQYRHATYDPVRYYKEALRRNIGDVRCNNRMGLWYLKNGMFDEALEHFDKAIHTLTARNPNPNDGEPFFNKGITLKFLFRYDEAYDAFYKSCWNANWKDAGYFNLAQIDCIRSRYHSALELVDQALIRNSHHHSARHLKIILLRKSGMIDQAGQLVDESLKLDPFSFGALYEKYLLTGEEDDLIQFKHRISDQVHSYIEFSLDYAQAGLYEESISLLSSFVEGKKEVYPMVHYFLGWYFQQSGARENAINSFSLAEKMPMDYCFPNRPEEVLALNAAMKCNPSDAKAPYYLGNYWYSKKQYNVARNYWEQAVRLDTKNSFCHRNLALFYFNKEGKKELAKRYLTTAFNLDHNNARLLMELDQLHKKLNSKVESRLLLLENNLPLTLDRDDLYLERISLYNVLGKHDKALELLNARQFHPWEGGEGKVPFQYTTAHIEIAKEYLRNNEYGSAISHLKMARDYPENLGEGKLWGTQENDIDYWTGNAYEQSGDILSARKYWQKASVGLTDPTQAMFYNDQQPDKIFYQGLALLKLGDKDQAGIKFNKLIRYGLQHKTDTVKLDYFAVSLPDLLIWEEDLDKQNEIHCSYLIGLGKLGLGKLEDACEAFQHVMNHNIYHLSGVVHCRMTRNEMALINSSQDTSDEL